MPSVKFLAAALSAGLLLIFNASAADFTHTLAQADAAVKAGDTRHALDIYARAQTDAAGHSALLCLLCRRYCDLMHQTQFMAAQKDLLARALACARDAVKADPTNAVAHASLAVCYAKDCQFASIKNSLTDSRLFKDEALEAIRLDPRQDASWYLLGRWNYAIANVGFFSRTYVKLVYGSLPPASNADAIKDFQKAIAINPNHSLYYDALGNVDKTIGDKQAAVAAWQKCLTLPPLDPDDTQARQDARKALGSK